MILLFELLKLSWFYCVIVILSLGLYTYIIICNKIFKNNLLFLANPSGCSDKATEWSP
jgi:hypothetical protein